MKPNDASNGRFGNKVNPHDNSPVVGFTLRDYVDNSSPDYFQKHLSQPDLVTIELEASRPDENGAPIVTRYTINLNIIYLQGPNIDGYVTIGNCALPGEIVNATAEDINVALSEELVIEDRKWVVMSPDKSAVIDVTDYRNDVNYRRLELPVWFYNDGWDLFYRMVINGETFDVGADPKAEHPNIIVHNYHRMKAMYGTDEIYQALTPGCRIYIEDAADIERFIALADTLSMGSHTPIAIKGTHLVDRPADCEGLLFFLGSDLTIPAGHPVPARFAGSLYGNGYTLTFDDATPFIGEIAEAGALRDIGFVGHGNSVVANSVSGTVQNCFYCSPDLKGGLRASSSGGNFINCYQNTLPSWADTYAPTEDFLYGRVAYNVNGYYLKGRYDRLLGGEPDVDVLNDFYYEGDYRYARYDSRWGVGLPTALRTTPRPNYMNYERTGRTNHNMAHPEDLDRHVAAVVDAVDGHVITPEHYKPLWVEDFIKFGHDLTMGSTQQCPSHIADATRVYRSSGFYRGKQDRGFHFNINAVALHPWLTAIDFTGCRDKGVDPDLVRTVNSLSDRFCAPMLDLPGAEAADYGIATFTVDSNETLDDYDAVTRNLLVYTGQEAAGLLMPHLAYTEETPESSIAAHLIYKSGDEYAASAGLLHLVDKQDFNAPIPFAVTSRAWYERAPGDFSTGENAWDGLCLPFPANRVVATTLPDDFGHGVHEAYNERRNHGEITHFYGDEQSYDSPNVYNRLHEYWLRSLAGADGDDLIFARPGMAAFPYRGASGAVRQELQADYHYSNTWFSMAYGDYDYVPEHDQYTAAGADFGSYRFLTADIPYIVSFPSERYYEFDLSGRFYQDIYGETQPFAQTIRYEYLTSARRAVDGLTEQTRVGGGAALDKLVIGVSDDADHITRAGDHLFTGTFMRRSLTDASAGVIDEDGIAFRRASYGEAVLPFRAYLADASAINAPYYIAAPASDPIVSPGHDDEGSELDGITFMLDGDTLVALSSRQASIPLCDTAGRVCRILDIDPGRNEFTDIPPGIYLAGNYKFRIR